MQSKLNFAIRKNTYKRFQKEDTLDILMEKMRLLRSRIIVT